MSTAKANLTLNVKFHYKLITRASLCIKRLVYMEHLSLYLTYFWIICIIQVEVKHPGRESINKDKRKKKSKQAVGNSGVAEEIHNHLDHIIIWVAIQVFSPL